MKVLRLLHCEVSEKLLVCILQDFDGKYYDFQKRQGKNFDYYVHVLKKFEGQRFVFKGEEGKTYKGVFQGKAVQITTLKKSENLHDADFIQKYIEEDFELIQKEYGKDFCGYLLCEMHKQIIKKINSENPYYSEISNFSRSVERRVNLSQVSKDCHNLVNTDKELSSLKTRHQEIEIAASILTFLRDYARFLKTKDIKNSIVFITAFMALRSERENINAHEYYFRHREEFLKK
jgi:hypothetical protein